MFIYDHEFYFSWYKTVSINLIRKNKYTNKPLIEVDNKDEYNILPKPRYNHLQDINSRQQNSPKFPILRCLEAHIPFLDFQRSFLQGITMLVHDESTYAPMNLAQKFDQRL